MSQEQLDRRIAIVVLLTTFLLGAVCGRALADEVILRDRPRQNIFGTREVFVDGSFDKDKIILCSKDADVCCNPLFYTDGTFHQIFCAENVK